MVEGAPKNIKEGVAKAEAEDLKKKFEEAGAKIELEIKNNYYFEYFISKTIIQQLFF